MIIYSKHDEIFEVGSLWMSKNRQTKVQLDSIGTSIFRVHQVLPDEITLVRTGLSYLGPYPFRLQDFIGNFIKVPPEYYLKLSKLNALLRECTHEGISKEDIYNVIFEVEL
jgi:hypothetical protein